MKVKKKYISAVFSLVIGFYFMFPQSTEDMMMAEAATVKAPDPIVIQPDEAVEETLPIPEKDTYRDGLAAYITTVNGEVTEGEALSIVDCMLEQAQEYDIDEKLLMAVAHTESTYYSDAVSCADYKGLMQTGDVLAEEAGYSPEALFDPEVSIAVGAEYIDDQLETFDDIELALTAYNQGPGAVYEGDYTTCYAELTMERVKRIENFLSAGEYDEE